MFKHLDPSTPEADTRRKTTVSSPVSPESTTSPPWDSTGPVPPAPACPTFTSPQRAKRSPPVDLRAQRSVKKSARDLESPLSPFQAALQLKGRAVLCDLEDVILNTWENTLGDEEQDILCYGKRYVCRC